MRAGKVPPKTGPPPNRSVMGVCLAGLPTQTEVASCGVKPVNQASVKLLVGPLLRPPGGADRGPAAAPARAPPPLRGGGGGGGALGAQAPPARGPAVVEDPAGGV